MPFNPDEFLAEPTPAQPQSSGFDPDAFLAEPVSESQVADQAQAEEESRQAAHGSIGQQAITGLESAASTGTFGLSNLAETKLLGVKPEDIRAREEANPIASAVGSIAGLVNPLGIEGKVLTSAGKMAAEKLAPAVVEKGILAGAKRSAVKLATENALYQSGDEVAKMIKEQPGQSAETVITDIGLATVLGAGLGGGIGAVSPLWKATVGNKAGQFAADFKGRLTEHLNNPEPVAALADELTQYHSSVKSVADEVYGPKGLKASEIKTLLPDLTPKIVSESQNMSTKLRESLQVMLDNPNDYPQPLINKLTSKIDAFDKALQTVRDPLTMETKFAPSADSVFNAAQDLKQQLHEWGKFNKNFVPLAEVDFRNASKNLGHDMRTFLEDPATWGKAGERQQSINKAFSEYLPSLKDFEKKFTTELNGERVIDPGKVNTYVNQLGKANSELKQSMLENFVNASEKYKQVIADTHSNLGIENPIQPTSMNHIQSSLKDLSHGAKAADMWVKSSASKAGGAIVGSIAGALSHIPFGSAVGAYLGEKFLGSVMPGIAKSILEKLPSGEGLEAANKYGQALIKGAKLTDNAVKSIFKVGQATLHESKAPTEIQRKKLSAQIDQLQKDPSSLANIGGQVGHYMPDHATALGMTAQRVVSFLSSVKPNTAPKMPLDPPLKPSRAVQAQYDRALDIANQPLVVMQSLKDGTITSHDVVALQHMYPELYKGLQQKLMSEMISHQSKSEEGESIIPYKTRMGLSLFLAQPLDSTMSPMGILAAQPTPTQPQQAQDAPQGQSKGRPSAMKSNAYKSSQTPLQASESMHSTGKA